MATSGVARRYARAVFEIARDDRDLDGWLRDLTAIRDILDVPEMSAFLDSPAVPTEEKLAVLQESLKGVPPKRQNFVYVLVENHRSRSIDDVLTAFQSLVNQERGIVNARVTTAVVLDDAERDSVVRHLGRLTGKQVNVTTDVDPALIGGFVARIGDELIDASVVGRLAALRERLLG
jgi:F-type H+-transporting ATPase subunit delta